jgi:branched-chain amino acid transport system substrate-binding protein
VPGLPGRFDPRHQLTDGTVSRREALKLAGLAGGAAAATQLLAACSGGGSSNNAGSGGNVNPSSQAGGNVNKETVDQLHEIIGPMDEKTSGKGLTIPLGAVLALSGSASYYGKVMSRGINLATKQIAALGGPTFDVKYKDHKSGDPQAGITATRQLGTNGTALCLSSYAADLFAMLPGIKQYKMLTLDGGGGTSEAGKDKPYFWGTRAITPDDTYPGVMRYIKMNFPDAKRIASVGWDTGPSAKLVKDDLLAQLKPAGLDLVAFELTKVGATDFSTTISRVRQAQPDVVLVAIYGPDPGYFMKQYVTSGIGKPVIGSEFTPAALRVAGDAYNHYLFAYDYFDANHPQNDFAKLFVKTYEEAYGKQKYEPDFFAANYYEDVFAVWNIVRRTLKQGGDVKSGTALQKALEGQPEFNSVYGSSSNGSGRLVLDTKTHSVKKRPMGIFSLKDGAIHPHAYFNIGGANYRTA